MTAIKTTAIALTTAALLGVALTPSMAQTKHNTRADYLAAREARAQGYEQPQFNGMRAGTVNPLYPIASADPNSCVIDEGYGRWSSCQIGGN